MGLPPVVVGLFVTIFLWRNGPLGFFEILYTPTAMIIAQTVIATPIVMGITLAAIQQLPQKLRLQILALGATRLQMVWISDQGGEAPSFGCRDGRIWWRHLRGRCLHHGRWQHQGLFPCADHSNRHGNESWKFRYRHCPGYYPPLACLFHQSNPHPDPTEGKTEVTAIAACRAEGRMNIDAEMIDQHQSLEIKKP